MPGSAIVSDIRRCRDERAAILAIINAAAEAYRAVEALDDAHVSAQYRKQLATVLSRRSLEAAHARCRTQAAAGQSKEVQ